MFLLEYLKKLLTLLVYNIIPELVKLALWNLILCSLLLLSFINIVAYLLIIKGLDSNNKFISIMWQNKLLGKLILLYKESRIYFILFELVFFISLIMFIALFENYRFFSLYFYLN